jgi:hypothetical protein
MTTALFKRLFEVRFMHEFYLSDPDPGGMLFYSKTPAVQQTFLNKQIERGKYNILNDLDFEPTPETIKMLRGRRLKFFRNATGFVIGAQVREETLLGNIKRYKLAIPLEKGVQFSFYVRVKNHFFKSFTAMRLRPEGLAPFHFFTNTGKILANSPMVSLAEPIPAFQSGRMYEPGELIINNGQLQENVIATQTQAPSAWSSVQGNGYISENDRRVLGKQFRWNWVANPQTVVFTLLDDTQQGNAAIIKNFSYVFTDTNRSVALNFSRKTPAAGQTIGDTIPDGYYTLEAKGTFDTFTSKLYLHGELSAGNPQVSAQSLTSTQSGLLGIVQIGSVQANSGAPFLDDNGYLQSLLLPDGTPSHIIYEARWLNRSIWWRYRSDRDLKLQAIGAANSLFDSTGNDLVSKNPVRFQDGQITLANGVYLPNPKPDFLHPDPSGRYMVDILISKISNLIDAN